MGLTTIGKFGLTALAVAVGAMTAEAAPPNGYTYSVVRTLGELAPPESDGIYHQGDFEPGDINSRENVAFASDLAETDDMIIGEGLFARYNGITRKIARTGDPISGALNYGPGILSPPGMNDSGDVAFGFCTDIPSAWFTLCGTVPAVFRDQFGEAEGVTGLASGRSCAWRNDVPRDRILHRLEQSRRDRDGRGHRYLRW